MPITINGSGTVTGISAGGLPDGVITTDDIAANAVTDAKLSTGITDSKLSGTTCKAWVNFNGTGTVAIRASFNVSSITDSGTGAYRINLTNSFADTFYSTVGTANDTGNWGTVVISINNQTSFFDIQTLINNGTALADPSQVCFAVFR
jgi:hypothetical protein